MLARRFCHLGILLLISLPGFAQSSLPERKDSTNQRQYVRDTLLAATGKLYQREKTLVLSTLAFIDAETESQESFEEGPGCDEEIMMLVAGHALFPVIESFPSLLARTKVLPEYVSALDFLSRRTKVFSLHDIDPSLKSAQLMAFYLMQEAVKYSEYLFHDNPKVIADARAQLAQIMVALRRDALTCEDLESLDQLELIEAGLTETADIDRTEGVAVMLQLLDEFKMRVLESMPCEGKDDA